MTRIAMLAGCALALVAIACAGGGDGEEPTLEEYFTRLEVMLDDVAERTNDEDPFAEPDESASVEEQLEAVANFVADFGEAAGDFSDDLAALRPPPEAQAAHEALADAAQDLAENLDEALDLLENETSGTTLVDAFALLEEGGDPEAACNGLQDVADENEIAVALNCELE